MSQEITYCTTFNKILFEATGRNMLESFVEHPPEGDLVVCYEDNIEKEILDIVPFAHAYCLDEDEFLKNWLEDNKDIIPAEWGGEFLGCNCHELPKEKLYYKGHVRQCPGQGFWRRTCLWFRKIATLNYVINKFNYDITIFCDCDIIFTKSISKAYAKKVLEDNDLCYNLGPHRKAIGVGIESGFVLYQKPYIFVDKLIDCYSSQDFRKYDRPDDGYIMRQVLEKNSQIKSKDMVMNHPWRIGARVVEHSLFKDYIIHFKGFHNRSKKDGGFGIFSEKL